MAINYSQAVKDARMTAVRDTLGIGGAGLIRIGTSGMNNTLAEITLDTVSGTVVTGVLTFSGFPKSDISADNTGTAAEAIMINGNGDTVVSGLTVNTSGADVNLDSVALTAGQTVTLNSAAITHF